MSDYFTNVVILDLEDVRRIVHGGEFGTTGKLAYVGTNPASTFNLALGKIVLMIWEYVDILRFYDVLGYDWCLTHFISKKVSSSVTSLPAFTYCRSTLLTLYFRLYSLHWNIMYATRIVLSFILYTILLLKMLMILPISLIMNH